MKRIITLTMALAMLVSLVGMVPAQAKLYADYPFVYEPFEVDDLANQKLEGLISSGGSTSFTWSADGAGGSKGSLSVTEEGSFSHMKFPVQSSSMIVGQKIRYSCWIKPIDTDFNTKKVDFYIYGSSEKGTVGWNTASVNNVALKQGEWVYVETEKIWDGSLYNNNAVATEGSMNFDFDITKDMHIEIRIGSGNVANEVPKDSGNTSLTYLLDDVIIEPVNDKNTETVTDTNGLYAGSSFDDTNSLSAWSKTSGDLIMELANEPGPDGSPNHAVLKTPETGNKAFMDIKQTVAVQYNHLYKVHFWAKVNSADKGSFWFLAWNESKPPARTGFDGYPGYAQNNVISREWKYFEFYIYNGYKGVDSNAIAWGIRFFASSQHGQTNGESFSVDDFNIIDMGNVANGDFEMDQVPGGVYYANGAADADRIFASSPVPFWVGSGATVAKSDEVRIDDESTSAQSMLVSVTQDGGYAYQPVNLQNQTAYKISFWAKGNNITSEQPMKIRLDRAVDQKESKDAYDVPEEEILDTGDTLTNEWKYFEVVYQSDFTATGSPAATIIPRQPFMNFVVGDNAAGLSYFIDDVSIELYDENQDPDEGKYPYPYANNVSCSGDEAAGTTMTVNYEFVSDLTNRMEGGSVVRLLKKAGDGWVTLSMAEADWGIAQVEIPNEAAGADVKIELVPIDEQGLFGTVYAYEIPNVKKAFAVTPAFTKWDETTGEIASSTMIENNASSVGVQDMVLILAQFDENGAMLKVDTKPIQVELGFSEAVLLSTTAAQGAAKACLFVWSGTSLADAGETTYADMVSITK